jgi:hypothetical protein
MAATGRRMYVFVIKYNILKVRLMSAERHKITTGNDFGWSFISLTYIHWTTPK